MKPPDIFGAACGDDFGMAGTYVCDLDRADRRVTELLQCDYRFHGDTMGASLHLTYYDF